MAITRDDFSHFHTVHTRWMDNDIYGHVNNVVYYSWFDTVINSYIIEYGDLDIHNDPVVAYCVESQCIYKKGFAFPEEVHVGLRVAKLGNSSVRYELALFGKNDQEPRATGYFVHVFVDKASNKSASIPPDVRTALTRLYR
jgi:acyl-CoA thioester hydrolase